MRGKPSEGTTLPDNLLSSFQHADADVDIFPNIRILLEIVCMFPVTSSEAERSFSVLRRIKTSLKNQMGDDHLASLVLYYYIRIMK